MAVIFMTGAPHASDLNWDQKHLSPHFVARVRRYLQAATQDETTQTTLTAATHPLAKWREIPLTTTGGQRPAATSLKPLQSTQFLSFLNNPASQEHLNFLEHSLAILQSLDPSQINALDDTPNEERAHETPASFRTSLSTNLSFQPSYISTCTSTSPEKQLVTFNGIVTDLKRIPSAHYLQSIHPQTMTINLLASVISIQPARTVKLRKRPGEMDIIEILFGDETRAGFSVSFWIPPRESPTGQPSNREDELRHLLTSIRIGDTLLVTHVALNEFKNNVYGQSLSRRITRNHTSVIVLAGNVTGLSTSTSAKWGRVREWASKFVGEKHHTTTATAAAEVRSGHLNGKRPILPPDSFE